MAGSSLCVNCSRLPRKDRGAAVRIQHCPECHAEFGVTAWGAAFRLLPARRRQRTPFLVTGVTLAVGLFVLVLAIIGISAWISDSTARPDIAAARPAPSDLARVRELALHDPFPPRINPVDSKQRLIALVNMIKQENANKVDGFMHKRIAERRELAGLPFVMGDACRMQVASANSFQQSVLAVRNALEVDSGRFRFSNDASNDPHHSTFWNSYLAETAQQGAATEQGIAALTQMLGPQKKTLRHAMVQKLANTNRVEATKVIAKSAIFDPDGDVRQAAIIALKARPREDYTDVLLHGMKYPLAVVADRTSQAIIQLDRKDLLPQLVAFLSEVPPGDPEPALERKENACVVREVVRINHHRNCLLCHAPTSTGNQQEVPGVLPIPGTPFPESPRDAYGNAQSTGDPMVRADTTYLRQDFSVMMPVANAAPWPEMQRFDFLVRTRVLDAGELAALEQTIRARAANFVSEHHQAALRALRELTGQDAAPNAAAWQRVLAK